MRAILQWLALAPLLVFSGCRTHHSPQTPDDSGFVLSRMDQDRAEALAHYSQALISEATLGEAQNGLAHFRQAAALDPSYLPLSLRVAVDYIARRDYTGAVSVLRQSAREHPRSAEVQLLLGSLFQSQGNTADAVRAFQFAIQLAPEKGDGYVRLATLYVVRQERQKALAVIDSGLVRAKDNAPLLELCDNVGKICIAGKDLRGAVQFFERIRRYKPEREEVRELLGGCYTLLGRFRDAAAEYDALMKKHPDSSRLLLLRGELFEEAGDLEQARQVYRRATTGVPPEPLAFIRLAGLEFDEDGGKAIRTLDEAVARFPDDVRIRLILAVFYMRLDRAEDAAAQFARVAAVVGRDEEAARRVQPSFYFWYAGMCERAGRQDDAERIMAKYLTINPGSAEAMNTLAYLWAEQGRNLDQAMDYISKALLKEPGNGAYLDTLGWIHFKKGNYPLAMENLTLALKKEGDDPAILEHIGDTWLALKRKDKALKMWWKSIRKDPENKGLREKMVREGVDARTLPPKKK